MSGQKINDHSFWAGKRSKDSIAPMGVHHKGESSAEGAGKVSKYEDTTQAIKGVQEMQKKKVNSLPMKDGYRY